MAERNLAWQRLGFSGRAGQFGQISCLPFGIRVRAKARRRHEITRRTFPGFAPAPWDPGGSKHTMLKRLEMLHVGPAEHLGPLDFGTRLNLLTGDNGLGKSFVLDVAWWTLTGTWPERAAWPRETSSREEPAKLKAIVEGKTKDCPVDAQFDHDMANWVLNSGRPAMPGLVLYFRVDGRFSLWDPAQHYWRRSKVKQVHDPSRPDALHLGPDEVWDSHVSADGKPICRGLIEDWVTWQQKKNHEYALLQSVLRDLSPGPDELLEVGDVLPPYMLDREDAREHPTLKFSYGMTPVMLASAAVKRILALSYLLVWVWQGHRNASAALRQSPEKRLVILFDEPETHLHPQWQRRLLPALMHVANSLGSEVQLLVSTHAPLVLASVENEFDAVRDRLFHFDIDGGPHIDEMPFTKYGDVVGWLTSPIFGLKQARSVEAEEAINAARHFLRGEEASNREGLRTKEEIDARLRNVLGGTDPFWPRWVVKTGAS